MRKKKTDIGFIKDFIDNVISDNGIDKSSLYENGTVYYENGNDGTDFDFETNGRTCEFYVYYANGDGAIKCFVTEKEIVAYVYPEENPFSGDYKRVSAPMGARFDLRKLCEALYGTFDMNEIWDEAVSEWTLGYADDITLMTNNY